MFFPANGFPELTFHQEEEYVLTAVEFAGTLSVESMSEVALRLRAMLGSTVTYIYTVVGVREYVVKGCQLVYVFHRTVVPQQVTVNIKDERILTLELGSQFRFMKFDNARVAEFSSSNTINEYKHYLVIPLH